MKRVRGPFSFSINDETGLLVDGFDHPPNMMMGHALPYYAARVGQGSSGQDVIAMIRRRPRNAARAPPSTGRALPKSSSGLDEEHGP
jgi:hypothetical protein